MFLITFVPVMNVILSIRPNFCKLIFSGQKVYEYRKRVFSRTDVDKVYIYATKPICRVIGYFTIDQLIEDSPNNVWEKTYMEGGISKKQFNDYFKGQSVAHAIKIKDLKRFDTTINPKSVIKGFTAPQNFRYVDVDL